MIRRLAWGLGAVTAILLGAASGLPHAQWIARGIIDAGGSHEPYTFLVRSGYGSAAARQQYEHAQSEEVIRRLKEQGVEVFHTHLYKGFGMKAEMPEMEDAKRAAAIQRDAAGQPILLVYGFQQSYRYRPCFSDPNYLAYLKRNPGSQDLLSRLLRPDDNVPLWPR